MTAMPPMPAVPPNFDQFMPYGKPVPEKTGRMPPKVDTAVASMSMTMNSPDDLAWEASMLTIYQTAPSIGQGS